MPRADIARRRKAAAADRQSLLMVAKAIVIQKYCRGYMQRRLLMWLRPASSHVGDRQAACNGHADLEPSR